MSRRVPSIAVAVLVTVWLCALVGAQSSPPQAVPPVSFTTDVRPILERSCLSCHGDAVQMGKLDLRSREGALRGGTRGSDLIPGDSGGSRLYRRVAGLEQPAMPVQGAPLTAAQVATLKNWIDEGATWDAIADVERGRIRRGSARRAGEPPHHAGGAELLGVQAAGAGAAPGCRRHASHQSDRSVSREGASGTRSDAGAAGRSLTLVRRAYLDLLGLPPTPDEVDAFVADQSPERVGAPDRQAARLAALRRALRPPLARRRALCRLGRLRVRHGPAQRVALSRLRHRVVQRRQAVRPVS